MNKFAKLEQIVTEAGKFLLKPLAERQKEIREKGLVRNPSPDALHEADVRYLISVEARVAVNNEAEYALMENLEEALTKELSKQEWKIYSYESWIHHLDGPQQGQIV
ncbi:hypothetical protein [Nocardioides sp. Leaf307]|uniref:hypothetical protein n=1 Tax=Nocardioides sp. Leaf307 TaxID=1736331 RepID=UPI0012E9CA1C|nr:hypothetical protein [Nocardioides sp. Leaf307]